MNVNYTESIGTDDIEDNLLKGLTACQSVNRVIVETIRWPPESPAAL